MEVYMSNNDLGPLPEKPSLDQLRKQAKELRAAKNFSTLAEAQLELARAYGFSSWPELKLRAEQIVLRRLIQAGETDRKSTRLNSSHSS